MQSKPVREGFPCKFNFKWHEGSPPAVKTTLPDSDTLSILLHRLRPFILKSEPASFEAVCSLVGKAVANQYTRLMLRNQRELYDGRRLQGMMKVTSEGVVVNSERVLYDWLNSHEYHRDPDKRDSIDKLFQRIPGDLMRVLLITMLVDKMEAISSIASFIRVLLTESKIFQFKMHDTKVTS